MFIVVLGIVMMIAGFMGALIAMQSDTIKIYIRNVPCQMLMHAGWISRMREQHPELKKRLPTLWTRSAFISSVGAVSLAAVQQYIDNQKNQ